MKIDATKILYETFLIYFIITKSETYKNILKIYKTNSKTAMTYYYSLLSIF